MIVLKFGGATIPDAEGFRCVANIIKRQIEKKPVVVLSAVGNTTDILLELCHLALKGDYEQKLQEEMIKKHFDIIDALGISKESIRPLVSELVTLLRGISLVKELSVRIKDYAMSFGERFSTRILAAYLEKIDVPAQALDAWDIGMITDNNFGNASPLPEAYSLLQTHIQNIDKTPVITGFIGKTKDGEITTLGRNGSDYTATIIGSAIGASEIQIWRNTGGTKTADPKLVSWAKPVRELSFDEASEIVFYGSGFLHPATLTPAREKNIPIRILNIFDPEEAGTTLSPLTDRRFTGIKSIACKGNQKIITITAPEMSMNYGYLAKIFDIFARHRIVIDVVSTSEVSVSVTVNSQQPVEQVISKLKEFATVEIEDNISIICVIGDGIKYTSGIAGQVFDTLGKEKINVVMISQGASRSNLIFVVKDEDAPRAVKSVHKKFFGE